MMSEDVSLLFSKIKAGEDSFFEAFYNLTKKKIFYLIYSYVRNQQDAEDILQETYLSLLEHRRAVKVSSVMSYLFKIAQNKSLNFMKKKQKMVSMNYEQADVQVMVDASISQEAAAIIQVMNQVLNEMEFKVVTLHVLDEMSHKEIAKFLKKPIGTITWTYQNALQKVRRRLK